MRLFSYHEINVSYDFLSRKDNTINSTITNCFKNKQFSLLLKMNIRYGNLNLLKLIKIVHNNSMMKKILENISINNVVEDNNDDIITFSINKKTLSINFNNNTITYNNSIFYYDDKYIITNNKTVVSANTEQNTLNKFIDFNDPLTNSIINRYWSKNDRKKFANKLSAIIDNLPLSFNKKLFTKMKFSNNTIANINEFTLINNNKNKLHCILNNNNKYDCYVL